MTKLEEWMNIKQLHQEGHSIRMIAQMTGMSRNTVRKALQQKTPQPYQKPERSSLLDAYKPYVEKRFQECRLSAVRLMAEIGPMGYQGSVVTLRRFLQHLRPDNLAKLTVRFETPPGQQAQLDWAYCGRFPNKEGRIVSIYAFVMVLSFSRMMFVAFTTSMKLATLINCHLQAFEYFGGWTRSILYDNMKQVKLAAEQWNPLFIDFVNYYDIVPKTHQVRRPRTKGKVERMVDYVKDNFLNGRVFTDLADLNAQARHWLAHTANVRIHATTKQRPVDLFTKEGLIAWQSIPAYKLIERSDRKVDVEGMVHFQRSRYSVPPVYIGKPVIVEQYEQRIMIRCGSLIIAEHPVAPSPGSCMAAKEHIEAAWKLSLNCPAPALPKWEISFSDRVETTPLTQYEEVAQ